MELCTVLLRLAILRQVRRSGPSANLVPQSTFHVRASLARTRVKMARMSPWIVLVQEKSLVRSAHGRYCLSEAALRGSAPSPVQLLSGVSRAPTNSGSMAKPNQTNQQKSPAEHANSAPKNWAHSLICEIRRDLRVRRCRQIQRIVGLVAIRDAIAAPAGEPHSQRRVRCLDFSYLT